MVSDELKQLLKYVWYTLKHEECGIVENHGEILKYFIAGSFATHLDNVGCERNGTYIYNDIDVFVMDSSLESVANSVISECYDIANSYKVRLREANGTVCDRYLPLKVNIVCVDQCCGLMHLLNFFDINSCQVGYEIDIKSGKLSSRVCTKHYLEFQVTEMLKVVTFNTPATSLFRLMKKSFQMSLPRTLDPMNLMKLKWNNDGGKVVNKGLFEQVRSSLERNDMLDEVAKNFDYDILYPSEDEINEDLYFRGEEDELSASMSFLIKNGSGIALYFHGNRENEMHFSCINGENDKFRSFQDLVDERGSLAAFEKDELNLSCVDYLLCNPCNNAIHANNYLITQMLEQSQHQSI